MLITLAIRNANHPSHPIRLVFVRTNRMLLVSCYCNGQVPYLHCSGRNSALTISSGCRISVFLAFLGALVSPYFCMVSSKHGLPRPRLPEVLTAWCRYCHRGCQSGLWVLAINWKMRQQPGVQISKTKSWMSDSSCDEFAKRFVTPRGDLSPISIKMIRSCVYSIAVFPVMKSIGLNSSQLDLRLRGAGFRRYSAKAV